MMSDLIERLRLLEQDHEPDGWPAVRMRDITALLDSLEAAREDAERLDWLDAQRGDDVRVSYPSPPELVGHYWTIYGQLCDVRAAIDADRAKEVGPCGGDQ